VGLNYPMLILSLVLVTLYSALFHLLLGRTFRHLLSSWLAAAVGFAVGQLLSSAMGWRDLLIGELHLAAASFVSWLMMALARRLEL
jgi:uncharacterized membrane protein YjjP (DUF1212 family)